jgi:hypothetical protein
MKPELEADFLRELKEIEAESIGCLPLGQGLAHPKIIFRLSKRTNDARR